MIRKIVKWFAFKVVYPCAYKIGCLKKQDHKKVIFAEIRHSFLTDSYRLIYDQLKNKPGYKLDVVYLVTNSGGLSYLWRYLKLCFKMGSVGCILCDDTCNLFGAFKLRKGTKLIQTWHSCGAFKKWGECISDLSFGEDISELRKYPAHINYTLCTVSSEECIKHFKAAFGLPEENNCVKAIGVSRTDVFFRPENKEKAFKSFSDNFPKAEIERKKGKKLMLYAPTYRGDADNAYIPEKLDIELMKDKLGDEYLLLIKRHGFVRKDWEIPESCRDFAFDVSNNMKIEELLFISDLCITDYSSLVFEYSLFLRPMYFFAFDLEEFYDYRGFFYDYKEFVPGPIVKTSAELADKIKNSDGFDLNRIKEFQNRFMGACDGHSTRRIVDYITDEYM